MAEAAGLTNRAVNWNRFCEDYFVQYGVGEGGEPIPDFTLAPEDTALNRAFVAAVEDNHELQEQLGTAHRILDVCVGGVLRTSLLMAPFLAPEDSVIEMADIGDVQLASTQRALDRGRDGDPGAWLVHAQDIAEVDTNGRWEHALPTVFEKGLVVCRSIFDLKEREYDAGTTGFGPESLTGEMDEWEVAVLSLAKSIKKGGVFAMHYMVGSTGWRGFPAVRIYEKSVEHVLKGVVKILCHVTVPSSGIIRPEDDASHYDGMALVMGVVE